ncbi:MAG: bifunctional riboflavin kinase/FAD synthetase [Gammaproteobacteria bacterium]|nr:bifunctional riboflavin kinase/FAD synthetase [Gammaproteobacteria bacterium]
MRLVRHLSDLPFERLESGTVVTIGSFDGLHLGHRQLLERVITIARREGRPSLVMSFEPTPKEFFQAEQPPARLMRFREKFDALAASGIDIFYCPRFSTTMRNIAAADFVRCILIHGLNVRRLVVGDDFQFAAMRQGNIELLESMGKVLDFSVDQVPSVVINDIRVSSTAIREACQVGDMQRATALLGRPYRMSGKIVKGDKVGRTLGFPTANVDLRRRQSAVMGIFAVRVHGLKCGPKDGVASVGTRPTFDGTKPILEVYLFDFSDDIYGAYIHVDFVARLREQQRYDAVEDLVAQMHIDADNARSILANAAA